MALSVPLIICVPLHSLGQLLMLRLKLNLLLGMTLCPLTYLMGQFMGDDLSYSLLVGLGWLALWVQQVDFPVGDQAPVLHGTGDKVRNGDHVWMDYERGKTEADKMSSCCLKWLKGTVSSWLEQTFNRAWNWCPSLRWTQWLTNTDSFMQHQW